jgi:two-component system, NtrC family, sensor histidine kinase AtoS
MMKRTVSYYIVLIGILFSFRLQGQDEKLTRSEIPPEIENQLISEHFKNNSIFTILWTNYKTETLLLIVALLTSLIGLRRYSKNVVKQDQRLFDTLMSNAVMIFDKTGDLQLINRAAKQLLGLDEFVSLQEDYQHYFRSAPSPEIIEIFETLKRSRHAIEKEIVFSYQRVMHTLIVKGYPLYTESKRLDGFVLVIADITEAIERDRRVNWSGVAQHVAHKAKTPLSTITLTAQHIELLLREQYDHLPPEISKYIDRIVGESKKLNEIVHNLTRLANKEQLNLLPNDVNVLIQSIADDYSNKVGRNIEIITHTSRSLPKVGIDIAHFPEAVQNLMDNAMRAIGIRDGRIIITTALGQWINRPGEYVEITIQDTGEGMTDEVKKSIFRPFATHSQGGTGLGLVIVQKIVQEHSGEITFISSLGVGTTFQIRLPVTKY